MLDSSIRPHIYAIYGLVRLADEIVDSYNGSDRTERLDALEQQLANDLASSYSTNLILHAFIQTARKYDLPPELTKSFFESMRIDGDDAYTEQDYDRYIYGSAEVVGLMSLLVFCQGDKAHYEQLVDGARALGRAYQNINFLRDLGDDYRERGRVYFPGVTYQSFDDKTLKKIILTISKDMIAAKNYIAKLPSNSRLAVNLSYQYYDRLLAILANSQAETIKNQRLRVPDHTKAWLFARARLGKWIKP